jgi:integrase
MMPFAVRHRERQDFRPAEVRRLLDRSTIPTIWADPTARQAIYRDGWRLYSMSLLLAVTGARWSAVAALESGDITQEAGYYVVRLDKALAEIRGVKPGTKTGRGTLVPVAREVLDQVLPHLPESGPLFPSFGRRHGHLTHHTAIKHLKAAMIRAGISERAQRERLLGFHSWKHTFVTRARAAGLSAEVRSAFTEHRDERTAGIYTHLAPIDLLDALPVQRAMLGA